MKVREFAVVVAIAGFILLAAVLITDNHGNKKVDAEGIPCQDKVTILEKGMTMVCEHTQNLNTVERSDGSVQVICSCKRKYR